MVNVKIISLILLSIILSSASIMAEQNLILNGDFEEPGVSSDNSNGWITFEKGQIIGSGWIVEENSVDIHQREYSIPWHTISGLQALDLSGDSPGCIDQDIDTEPGKKYELSFYMAANLACAPSTVSLKLYINNNIIDTVSFNTVGHSFQNMGWQLHKYKFNATDSVTRIKFCSLTDGPCGPAIDLVKLSILDSCSDKYDEGFEAGKQYCINNPSACGLYSNCDCNDGNVVGNMCATFNLFTNTLHVPCLEMGTSYWLDLKLINTEPVQLELTGFGENQ